MYRILCFIDPVSIPSNHVSYNTSSFYTCSIEFLHNDILKISIPFSTTLLFAKINIQQTIPQNFGCKFLWVGESSYDGEQHTFGFNYLINNFPDYFISQRATVNWGSQYRNKPRLIHFDHNDKTDNVCVPRDGKLWTDHQHFKKSNYKQREAQHCGMIIIDCITNTLQDVSKMQPTLQQKAHDLSVFSAAVNNTVGIVVTLQIPNTTTE